MKTNRFMLFKDSNAYKSAFTFLSLISILVLSLVILFTIDSFPLSEESWNKTIHKSLLLFIIWNGGVIINKNLHLSKHGDLASYFMLLFLNSFLISMVIFRINYIPGKIYNSVSENYFYFLALMIFNLIWKVLLYFFEKNARPYFSKYLFWNISSIMIFIAIIAVAEWNLERYLIDRVKYNYLDKRNISIILTMPIVFILYFYFVYMSFTKISKYANSEKTTTREIILWNSFFRIFSLAVWAIYSIRIQIETFTTNDKIYASISLFIYFISIVSIIYSLIKKQGRFLVYIFTTNLIIMSTLGFIFVNVLNSTPSDTFIFFIIFTVLFNFMFILLKPKLYRFYPQLNSILSFLLVVFILVIWSGNQIIGEINFLNINEIIWGSMLIISLLMFGLQIFSELFLFSKLNRSFSKIIKNIKKEKKMKKLKGVGNV